MKNALIVFILSCMLFLSGCYDASEVEETAYLIALGIDKGNEGGYNYTFQFAAPLAISKGGEGGGGGAEQKEEDKIPASKNPSVKNVVIAAPDFYTAKNMLANYLSKTLNMSHLKLIVCSEDFAESALKKHTELFSQEREIRPGTFMAVSSVAAEEFLKAVNPVLEGSTSKYYELSNSEKTLVYAPSMRLGDFLNAAGTFDKSSVLPIANVNKKKSSEELVIPVDEAGISKSGISRISDSAAELYGMGIFKDSTLTGKMSGDEARLYNILSGDETRFTFSVRDEKNSGETLSFDTLVLKKPVFRLSEPDGALKITAELSVNMEFIGTRLPKGYNDTRELLDSGERILKDELTAFLLKTSREFSADILKTERFYKSNFLTIPEMNKSSYIEKYKNADFEVKLKRANRSGSTVSGEIS